MLSGRKTYLLLANKKDCKPFSGNERLGHLVHTLASRTGPRRPSAFCREASTGAQHSSHGAEDRNVLCAQLLPDDAGVAGGNFSAIPLLANAAHAAMPCTTRAETCLVKAPLALPFSLHFHLWLLGTDGRRAEMHRCRNTYGFSHFLPCHLRKSEI